jgi:serine/threonine protein kinase
MVSSDHKNIIKIYYSFEMQETFYLIMEWMDGGDLSTMIKIMPA